MTLGRKHQRTEPLSQAEKFLAFCVSLCSHGIVRFSSLVSSRYLLFFFFFLAVGILFVIKLLFFPLISTLILFLSGRKGLVGIKGR